MSVIPISGLNAEEQALQERSIGLLKSDGERLIAEYRDRFGVYVGTDFAREMFPEYTASIESRLKYSVAVQKPAAYLADRVFEQIVSEETPGAALFTAGGTGAGKTDAINKFSQTSELMGRAHVVYDSNFNSEKSAFLKVDAALSAGRSVVILFVHRHPIEAYLKGVIPRAVREGRTVPIEGHLRMHSDAVKVVRKALKTYAQNPQVGIVVLNNTGHEVEASPVTVDPIEYMKGIRYDSEELRRAIKEGLDHARKHGQITEELYQRSCGTP
jgi:hypothetical protein